MIKLNQINITEPINKVQENTLRDFVSGDTHVNGKIYVKKINRTFDNGKLMQDYKLDICKEIWVNPIKILLIYEEVN